MPELPEVETYIRDLEPDLRGRSVTGASVTWPRTIAWPDSEQFVHAIVGATFDRFNRRGKYMLFGLADGRTLVVHLRMTGKFSLVDGDAVADKHVHVVLQLDDGRKVHFQDTRKFGRIWLTDDLQNVIGSLGPEPLGDEFTAQYLAERINNRKASIKALILDQSIIAGIGNIYADESLFVARIHPARPGGSLTPDEVVRLHDAIVRLLAQAIELQGSTLGTSNLQNYSRPGGQSGSFQETFQVFRRTDEPCFVCGTPIERIVVGQRGTHFCPHCQPLTAS